MATVEVSRKFIEDAARASGAEQRNLEQITDALGAIGKNPVNPAGHVLTTMGRDSYCRVGKYAVHYTVDAGVVLVIHLLSPRDIKKLAHQNGFVLR